MKNIHVMYYINGPEEENIEHLQSFSCENFSAIPLP